jgi:hypothetical protein
VQDCLPEFSSRKKSMSRRLKFSPFGGALAIDYGFLLNRVEFLIPQRGAGIDFDGTPAIYRLNRTQIHFRFSQTF